MSRVFVVDDHADDLDLYANVLRHAGYDAVPFSSPVEALEAIARERPDVVLVDLLMPELDGFELVHALRADPTTRDQRVVLASAVYSQREFAGVSHDLSGCTFLPKPATPDELVAAIGDALARKVAFAEPSSDFTRRHRRTVHAKLLSEGRRWERAERELTIRARHDGALAVLSRYAIEAGDNGRFLDEACAVIRDALGVTRAEALEPDSSNCGLRLVAVAGRPDETVDASAGEWFSRDQADRALSAPHPTDIGLGAPEALPARLSEAGVVSGLLTPVHGTHGALGLIGIYELHARLFTDEERTFLGSAANVVASALSNVEAKASLERSERELSAIFDGARDALVVVDADLHCVRVNAAATELLGRTARSLIGMTAAEIVAPESLHELVAGWAAALPSGGGGGIVTILRPDGERRTTEYSTAMDVVPGFHLVSLRDVTERLAMETMLRQTMGEITAVERRYAELIETLPDGIVAVNADGTIALVNAQTEKMFGYLRGEIVGRPLELLIPERYRAAHELHRAGFSGARSRPMGIGLDLHGRRKDGTEFPVEVSLSSVKTDQGVLVTSVVTDITERTQLERQLQQAQKLEAVGRLAGGIAHDFNNVLQVIAGYAASLQASPSPSDLEEGLSEIATAADRAASLTRQLLAFSRRQIVRPLVLDLNDVVRDMERMLCRMIGEDVAMSIELDPAAGSIRADRAQIEQILANLAVNARDAMPNGGRLKLSTERIELDADAVKLGLQTGTYIRLSVADTGSGMDEATAANAFEPFFTTKEDGRGTGLGLAMVHGIVAQSGGAARIESELGAGTTISIFLPVVEAATTSAPHDSLAPAAGGTERVLLVEDEPVVRRLIRSFLAQAGYRVTGVETGLAALEAARASDTSFDLVVTDFVLPGMSGTDLASRLREFGCPAPVLYMSGYVPGDLEDAMRSHASGFLQKPFTSEQLLRAVRNLLDAPVVRA